MPFTPYHFGPSGFFGLVLKKWVDFPVFVLANVVIDVEVLVIGYFKLGTPVHRYVHTLLFGAIAGIIWGLCAWPFRNIFGWFMKKLRIAYEAKLWKMILGGVLGIWLHVVIDAIYHWDVRVFWPSRIIPLYKLFASTKIQNQHYVRLMCLVFWGLLLVSYGVMLWRKERHKSTSCKTQEKEL